MEDALENSALLIKASSTGDTHTLRQLLFPAQAHHTSDEEKNDNESHSCTCISSTQVILSAADPNTPDAHNETALHLAAFNGHNEAVGLLLKAGADPARKGLYGRQPLHYAAARGHFDAMRELLTLTKIATKTKFELEYLRTQVNLNTVGSKTSIDPACILIDPNARDDNGRTPFLHASLSRSRQKSEDSGNKSEKASHTSMRLLLEYGAEMDAVDRYGKTALHHSSSKGYADVVHFLLSQGASTNGDGIAGDRPSSVNDHTRTGKYGSSHDNIKLNTRKGLDMYGNTCLHYAILEGHIDIALMLLDAGADTEGINEMIRLLLRDNFVIRSLRKEVFNEQVKI